MSSYTFEQLLNKMDEKTDKFEKWIENADKIPLEQLKEDAVGFYRESIDTKTHDLYSKTDGHSEITLFCAAVSYQYTICRIAANALSVYAKRLERESPKSHRKNKDLLSLDMKKKIAEQVKREISRYKNEQFKLVKSK